MTARSIVAAVVLAAGCAAQSPPVPDAASPQDFTETFTVDARDWASSGTNPYFVLEPGHRLEFEGTEHGRPVRLAITVLAETKRVAGVETRVVEERESEDGELTEVSRNYFAYSRGDGGVYYFGEDVDEYEDGTVSGHGGSWHAGENGATYGLMVPGRPVVGARHYQEHAPGVAMDRSEILSLSETLETPAGTFEKCMKVEETTPLEKGREFKLYAPGVGLVKDGTLRLVRHGNAEK